MWSDASLGHSSIRQGLPSPKREQLQVPGRYVVSPVLIPAPDLGARAA